MSPAIVVRHNSAAQRYETEMDGHRAVTEYRMEGNTVIFHHTFVPPELRGRGVAEALVKAALEETRDQGRHVIAQCSYVAKFLQRHPEFQALLADE